MKTVISEFQIRKYTLVFVALCVSVLWPNLSIAQDFLSNLFTEDKPSGPTAEVDLLLYETVSADIVNNEAADQHILDTDTRVMLSAKVKDDKWEVFISGAADHGFYLGDSFESIARFEPWLMYGAWHGEDWDLSFGNQITRWGRGAVSIHDIANPSDLRRGLSVPDEWARRPVLQLKYDKYFDNFSLHGLYNPFFRETLVGGPVGDWSPIALGDQPGLEEAPIFEQSLQQQVFPGIKDYPADDFLHGELGLWMLTSKPGWDFGLYYFTGYDRVALPQFTDDFKAYVRNSDDDAITVLQTLELQEVLLFNPLYIQKPERNHTIGADLSTTFAGYTWRVEAAFAPQFSVYRDDLEFLRPPMLNALLGIDSLATDGLVISLNFMTQWIMVKRDVVLMQTESVNAGFAGAIVWDPEEVPIKLEFRGGVLVTDGSMWLQPWIHYPFADGHQISAGVEVIEGQPGHIAGTYSHNDNWLLRYRYNIGAP